MIVLARMCESYAPSRETNEICMAGKLALYVRENFRSCHFFMRDRICHKIYILPEIQFISFVNLYRSLKSILYRKALVSMSCSMFIDSHLLRKLIKLFNCFISLFYTKWFRFTNFFCTMTCLFILFNVLKEKNSTATRQL